MCCIISSEIASAIALSTAVNSLPNTSNHGEKGEIIVPESVTQAKKRFRARVNPVLLFVDEMCALSEGNMALPNDLYRHYSEWCEDAKVTSLGKQRFYEQILTNYNITKKRSGTKDYFIGIGIVEI